MEKPNEASGYLFKDNTIFSRLITENKSRTHFVDMKPENLLRLIDEYGIPSAIFHSHPGEAKPSSMDLEYMKNTIPYLECVWLIMSDRMKLRAWSISFGSSEFTGKQLRFPERGETIRPIEIEVKIDE